MSEDIELCRLCLAAVNKDATYLFATVNGEMLSKQIVETLNIWLERKADYPDRVCSDCLLTLSGIKTFRDEIVKSQRLIRTKGVATIVQEFLEAHRQELEITADVEEVEEEEHEVVMDVMANNQNQALLKTEIQSPDEDVEVVYEVIPWENMIVEEPDMDAEEIIDGTYLDTTPAPTAPLVEQEREIETHSPVLMAQASPPIGITPRPKRGSSNNSSSKKKKSPQYISSLVYDKRVFPLTTDELLLERTMKERQIFVCKLCSEDQETFPELRRHVNRKHTDQQKTYMLCCDIPLVPTSPPMLMHHMITHVDPIALKECQPAKRVLLRAGEKLATKVPKVTPDLDQAMRDHFYFVCNICNEDQDDCDQLVNHVLMTHPESAKTYRICCDMELGQNLYVLRNHMHLHLDPDAFKCPQCTRRFKDPATVKQHVLVSHEDDSKFMCPLCGKEFVRQRRLEWHIQNTHPESQWQTVSDEKGN